MLNRTIFTKLKIDGTEVTADELAEPFDVIVPAGRAYDQPTYQRKRPPVAMSGEVFYEGVSAAELTSTDLLELALWGTGSSKTVMVDEGSIEPAPAARLLVAALCEAAEAACLAQARQPTDLLHSGLPR